VREIDFVTLQYRVQPRIRKVESKCFQEQMELPVMLKGQVWSILTRPQMKTISTQTNKLKIGSDEEYESAPDEEEEEEKEKKEKPNSPRKIEENSYFKRKLTSLKSDFEVIRRSREKFEPISMVDALILSNEKSIFGLKQIFKFIMKEKSKNENIFEKILKEPKETKFSFRSMVLIDFPIELIDLNDRLTNLDLAYNLLTDVSCWFSSSFEYLTNLDLSHNFLFQLPNSFANLQKLKELNLSNNKFEYFPEPVLELLNLQSLNLKSNSLAYIPSEILKLKKNLTELDFS
jgi:Leucine-rich repeat (LRR) protein